MITEIPQNVLLGLLVATIVGIVLGYVTASIVSNIHTKSETQSLHAQLARLQSDAQAQQRSLTSDRAEIQASLSKASERAKSARRKEETLELHTQFLSQRIQSLESQVSSYEEEQVRIHKDFAAYKANKTRELALARVDLESWSESSHLPILNKRISNDVSTMSRSYQASREPSEEEVRQHESGNGIHESVRTRTQSQARSHTTLSLPLSQELDIPALAESELPGSVEELEFELVDFDTDGENSRG